MSPLAFRFSGPQGKGGERARVKTGPKPSFLPCTWGMCGQNFIKIGAGVWISIIPPHANRQRNIHLMMKIPTIA